MTVDQIIYLSIPKAYMESMWFSFDICTLIARLQNSRRDQWGYVFAQKSLITSALTVN